MEVRSLELLRADRQDEANWHIWQLFVANKKKKRYQLNNDRANLHPIGVEKFNKVSYFFILFCCGSRYGAFTSQITEAHSVGRQTDD
jgi:hypothetical protein